jgi:hypothetical protein
MGKDIRVFYLMNGQVIFADFFQCDEDTGDYKVTNAVMVMIGQNKQIAMSTAYPFSNIDEEIPINRDHVTTMSSLDWNPQLVKEYDNFWEQLRAKAAGIILPGDPNNKMP